MIKYIAFHLPQYHSFPENDEWWGNGFTDWVNVKNAVPLFDGHMQPVKPLDRNYYNMMSHSTRKWQAEIAQKYGLYGFCYYHYYFHGKLLMEKPLEALLEDKDINFPFCFCWANEPWTRAWDGKTSQVIMQQDYGDEKDWQRHIEYLIRFFKDERYIKIENKPLFIIYRTNNIPMCDSMIGYFNDVCRLEGFAGVYVCEEMNAFQGEPVCRNSDAVVAFEPSCIQRNRTNFQKAFDLLKSKFIVRNFASNLKLFDYNKIWKKILESDYNAKGKKLFYGAFVAWDNSPRKKNNGMIYRNSSPLNFEKALKNLTDKAKENNSEYIFINAWNEWAEGAYLEPDERFGYGYLEAVKNCAIESH